MSDDGDRCTLTAVTLYLDVFERRFRQVIPRWLFGVTLHLLLFGPLVRPTSAQTASPCDADTNLHTLDFWVGSWNVFRGDTLVGTNRISKVLSGCAVIEEWTDANGRRGHSLFYYHAAEGRWKQVWVTERALLPGGVKEKHLISRGPDGSVRFQGEIRLPGGAVLLDRTTLIPERTGEVRQVIEVSRDGGTTWRTTFDARYRRVR